MSDQVTKHDIKAIKDELVVLRQHMSNLFLADSLHNMSVKSEKVEETGGADSDLGVSDNKKKDDENETQSVWDIDDTMSESIREQNNGEETFNKVLRLQTMIKSMMDKMNQDEINHKEVIANEKTLEANLRASDSNARLLEYKLKASEDKINQLETVLRQERDKFDDFAGRQNNQLIEYKLKASEDKVNQLEFELKQERDKLDDSATEQTNCRHKFESNIVDLNEKLMNLERGQDQIMKQRYEDTKVTQSELEQMKKQMKLINVATSMRITAVYNCLTVTKEQLHKGKLIKLNDFFVSKPQLPFPDKSLKTLLS